MPYNATWIEPWMRPLKPRTLKRRKRKSMHESVPESIAQANLFPIKQKKTKSTKTIKTVKPIKNIQPKRSPIPRNNSNRRATRVRRISASKNWSKTLGTKI